MKTKLFKRLGATVLALGMALSVMAIPTSAIDVNNNGSITVNQLEAGAEVNIYQLTTVKYNYEADQPQAPVHSWVNNDVVTWLNGNNYSDYVVADTNNVNTTNFKALGGLESDQVQYAPFYADLEAAIEDNNLTLDPAQAAKTVEAEANSVTFNNVAMGLYLILTDGAATGSSYNPNAVYVGPTWDEDAGEWVISNYPTTVTAKGSMTPPPPTKTADESTNDGVQIGDTIDYTITYDLDNLKYPEGATNKTFIISDTLSEELTLNADSIQVFGVNDGAEDATLTATDDYKLDVKGNTFTVDFVYDNVSSYDSVKITYTATVNENAVTSAIDNDVSLTYNPDPFVDEDSETGTTTTVYTYGIEVTKVDQSETDTPLSGAEFKLQKMVNGAYQDVAVENYATEDGANHYRVDPDGAVYTMTSDANGKIYIEGLETGTYKLVETKAPAGYILPSNPETEVVINGTKGVASGTFGNETVNADDDMYVEGTIMNISESDGVPSLPTTGGMGTILFTTVGLVLVGGAAILLVVVYKRKKEN